MITANNERIFVVTGTSKPEINTMTLYFESKAVDDLFHAIEKKHKVYETSLEFSKRKSDHERVAFAYNLLENEGIFSNINLIESTKKTDVATTLRNEGNQAFLKKKDELALLLYNKSMCYAPPDGKEYALAIGNRSAVSFSLRCYNACLNDIDRALCSCYPKELHFKLLCRKVRCLVGLHKKDAAQEALKEAEEFLVKDWPSKLNEHISHIHQLKTDLQNVTNTIQNQDDCIESPEECLKICRPDCSFGQNDEILCASSSIELKYDTQFGRHIVATQDINPGHVLMVEKPFASVLLPDSYFTHCYHCLKRCFSSVPCHQCALVIFCDDNCRTRSWDTHHCIDCPLLPTVSKSVGKMGLLALKVLITATRQEENLSSLHQQVVSLEKQTTNPRSVGFDSSGHYDSSNYQTIHSLIGNAELRSNDDLFRRAIISGCLLFCLDKLTNFFDEIASSNNACSDFPNLKFFAGGLLLRYLQSIPCNAHEVSELVYRVSPVKDTPSSHEICEIGAALYGALSLLNHCCEPNAVRFSYLDYSVLRAIRNIRSGEQIVDNYGYHYALHSLKERQRPLEQQYFFACQCEACTENWPLYKDLPNDPAVIICSCGSSLHGLKVENGLTQCQNCRVDTNVVLLKSKIDASVETYSDIISRVFSEPPKRRGVKEIEDVLAHLLLLGRVKRPWRHFGGCQELLKMYFLLTASHCIFPV